MNPWRLPFFKIHQLSNTLGGDWVRYGEMLRSKKSVFGPSVCIPVPNQDSTQTHLRSEHFDSSQVLQLNSSYTPLTHETRKFYQGIWSTHWTSKCRENIRETKSTLSHSTRRSLNQPCWLVGLTQKNLPISPGYFLIFSHLTQPPWTHGSRSKQKQKPPSFHGSKDDTPCQAHPKRKYVSSRHVRSACPKSVKLR